MRSFEAKIQKNRTLLERLADDVTRFAGSFIFLILNGLFFLSWITFNSGLVPGVVPVDPFPFILLTMIVSLEAIFLSIFVLISQNRQSTINTLREEIHLQINQIAELEITKALKLITDLHRHQFPKAPPDSELDNMLKAVNRDALANKLEKELAQPLVIRDLLEKIPISHHKSK